MKLRRSCCPFVLFACGITAAHAQLGPPMSSTARGNTRIYQEPTQDTGTILKQELKWTSKIPLDKTYEQLTPEQLVELRSMYLMLAPADEPPFPEKGMKPIFSALKRAQRIRQARGEIDMVVTVDAQGNATKVEDLGGVYDIQMTETAQQVLVLTKYKPGKCSGTPCTMVFPFRLQLRSR
jgi:hypothetical protein